MYSITQYENAKMKDFIDCNCDTCNSIFQRKKHDIYVSIKRGQTKFYCNKKCIITNKEPSVNTRAKKICLQCNKKFVGYGIKFCSTNCAGFYNSSKRPQKEKLVFNCDHCGQEKEVTVGQLKIKLKHKNKYCSRKCKNEGRRLEEKEYACGMCEKLFTSVYDRNSKDSKCGKRFCNKSCRMSYYNKFHKIAKSNNKSRPEELFAVLIAKEFAELKILRNDRDTLKSGLELDINMPEIKLAIEINGPVHYMPIYGEDTLSLVMAKDSQKFAETHALGISLLVIDVSNWKSKKSQEEKSLRVFNEAIKPLIQEKLNKILAGDSAAESHQGYEPQV